METVRHMATSPFDLPGQGLLGINATYPLAPAAKWPSGAKNGVAPWHGLKPMRCDLAAIPTASS
jgi:hypothetical protein